MNPPSLTASGPYWRRHIRNVVPLHPGLSQDSLTRCRMRTTATEWDSDEIRGLSDPPRLNFLISDGRHLAASRWGNSLYWNHRRGIRDCAVCGLSHCPSADDSYRSVAIASEPITDETWYEVPDGSVIGVDVGARTVIRDLISERIAG
jgi:predicted glutamine amidotransferase